MAKTSDIAIRRLGPEDATAFRLLRLESLVEAPTAFASSAEDETAKTETDFAAILESDIVYGAFAEGRLLAIAGFTTEKRIKTCHKGHVWGVYVRPPWGRAALARALMEAIIRDASARVERIDLAVTATNEPARRLYERLGFEVYGLEKQALRWNGSDHDEVLMTRRVR